MDKLLSNSALVCASTSADLIPLGKTLYRNSPFSARCRKPYSKILQFDLMGCRLAHHYLLGKVSIHLQLLRHLPLAARHLILSIDATVDFLSLFFEFKHPSCLNNSLLRGNFCCRYEVVAVLKNDLIPSIDSLLFFCLSNTECFPSTICNNHLSTSQLKIWYLCIQQKQVQIHTSFQLLVVSQISPVSKECCINCHRPHEEKN